MLCEEYKNTWTCPSPPFCDPEHRIVGDIEGECWKDGPQPRAKKQCDQHKTERQGTYNVAT